MVLDAAAGTHRLKVQRHIDDISRELNAARRYFLYFLAPGLALAIFGVVGKPLASLCTSALCSLACLASGIAVGFLFGIPKILQKTLSNTSPTAPAATPGGPKPDSSSASPSSPSPQPSDGYAQRVNTNLEEISDWLTKIVVGLSLVNLGKIPPYLNLIASRLARDLGGNMAALKFFALAIIIYFSVVGLLSGYLFTRLFLQRAFAQADLAATPENVNAVRMQGAQLQISGDDPKAASAAAAAVGEVDQQLSAALQSGAKSLLIQLAQAPQAMKVSEVMPGFARLTPVAPIDENTQAKLDQLKALQALSLIKPAVGDDFVTDTPIELTTFGRLVAAL